MNLEALCRVLEQVSLPRLSEKLHPGLAAVRAIREAIGSAVADDGFLVDCFAHELQLIKKNQVRIGLVPFHTTPDTGVRCAFGYWAPGATPGPHEHTAWTVTAVCRNRLEVHTFDRGASYRLRRLVPKNHFDAPAGKVGYIFEPCIHAPINTSAEWSLSLHVTSPRDGEPLDDFAGPLPGLAPAFSERPTAIDGPYIQVVVERQRATCLYVLARLIAQMPGAIRPRVIRECYEIGSTGVRRILSKFRPDAAPEPEDSWRLERSHPDLRMTCERTGNRVRICTTTPTGKREEISVESVARAAIAFAVDRPSFEVRDLPGGLSAEERRGLAEALEDTGLFRRSGP